MMWGTHLSSGGTHLSSRGNKFDPKVKLLKEEKLKRRRRGTWGNGILEYKESQNIRDKESQSNHHVVKATWEEKRIILDMSNNSILYVTTSKRISGNKIESKNVNSLAKSWPALA